MQPADIKSMFDGIDDETKAVIARKLNKELASTILAVNGELASVGLTPQQLCPRADLIFHAFRLCPIAMVNIVVFGQDPYIGENEAIGLSFAVRAGKKIPPSLKNMFLCWQQCGLIGAMPTHGDLSNIAKQGVLFLNAALTTRLGVSNAHTKLWSKYTDAVIKELSAMPRQIIFIFLGASAKAKSALVDTKKHVVLEWGHPSPLNNANKTDNPQHFKYCTVFKNANEILVKRGETPINWDPDYVPIFVRALPDTPAVTHPPATLHAPTDDRVSSLRSLVPTVPNPAQPLTIPLAGATPPSRLEIIADAETLRGLPARARTRDIELAAIRDTTDDDPIPLELGTLYVFTDGGSTGNGFAHCRASYGYYITDGCKAISMGGIVEPVDIPGKAYKSSNQRGELSAIMFALLYVYTHVSEFDFSRITIVSDSEYSIKCLTEWINNWISNPAKYKLNEKMNLDLIMPAKETLDALKKSHTVKFIHMNSHMDEPADPTTTEWFMWKCNDIVDKICTRMLS